MLHYRALADRKMARIGDVLLVIFGFVVMVYTTALTINSWVNGHRSKPPGYCDK